MSCSALGENNHQSNPVVNPVNYNDWLARYAQGFSSSTKVMDVTKHSLIGFKTCSTRFHKTGLMPGTINVGLQGRGVADRVMGPRDMSIAYYGHNTKLPP